jgi:tRNA pseudouridine13 synthase
VLPAATIKTVPEDFQVDEIPAYEPSGEGEHLFVKFRKRSLTTDLAVRAIASSLDRESRQVGVAGVKDKIAITTQWVSVPFGPARGDDPTTGRDAFIARARALSLEGIEILEAIPHGHKLRTGHLHGNRFAIRLRGIEPGERDGLVAAIERMSEHGVPNFFGSQRFGRDGDNAERALAWLGGRAPGPRDPRQRRFLFSAMQSAVFNAVLQKRLEEGTWRVPLAGDLVKLRSSGGLFACTEPEVDRPRAERGELSPTGPMVGAKMRSPEGEPGALEAKIFEEMTGSCLDLQAFRHLGEGTRRALCMWVEELRVDRDGGTERLGDGTRPGEQHDSIWVYFVLPKGAYATTVLASVANLHETPRHPSASRSQEGARTGEETSGHESTEHDDAAANQTDEGDG